MNVLDALGGRSDVLLTLDFETHYSAEYGLKNLTTEAYVRDPRFEVIGVGVKYAGRPSVWLEEWEFREWARGVEWSRVTLLTHHAHFDALILSHHFGIRPRFHLDTLSMGRALHGVEVGNSLATLSTRYQIGTKGDEVTKTLGKRRADFTQTEWERYGAYCNNDVELTRKLADKMLPGFPVEELWLIDTTVRMFTEPVFSGDMDILEAALAQEKVHKASLLKRIAHHAGARPGATEEEIKATVREVLGSSDKFADVLRKLGVEPPTKPGKKGQIYAFAKTDPGMQTLLEDDRDEIRWLAEARLGVKSNIVETRVGRIIWSAKRGPIPFYLRAYGAHTDRWSGSDGINPQNFNRGGAIRKAIIAPEGSVICVADSGQIEARVGAWVAGETTLLETFRRNDVKAAQYKAAFAAKVATLGHEPSKEESREIDKALAALGIEDGDFYSDVGSSFFGKKLSKKETPTERQVAKCMCLGLSFGMGWAKFAGELLKGMLGAPPVQFTATDAGKYGVDTVAFERQYGDRVQDMITRGARVAYPELLIHAAVADYFVRLYRKRNPRIVAFWESMGRAIECMARGESKQFGPVRSTKYGLVRPNGRVLRYPDLKRHANGEWTYAKGKKRAKIYGGLLTENVVQALARDIVAEQMLWIRAAGHRIGTCTHDEIVCVAPAAAPCLAYMISRMRIPPAWCADLPLNAEGGFHRSYGSAKA